MTPRSVPLAPLRGRRVGPRCGTLAPLRGERVRERGLRAAGLLVTLLAASIACAHAPEGPATTMQQFGGALARGDLRAAYALTSADFQKRTPYETFAAGMGSNPGDTAALGKRVGEQAARVAPRVDVPLGQGETLALVLDAGRWRIDGPIPEPWGQKTPRAALHTFVRALGERRYDVVMRLVPRRHRVDLTADKLRQYWEAHPDETRALLGRLQGALAAPIVESGDEAHMPYGPEQEVVFVREDGIWRIEDPD
jgi:hypothetical protein